MGRCRTPLCPPNRIFIINRDLSPVPDKWNQFFVYYYTKRQTQHADIRDKTRSIQKAAALLVKGVRISLVLQLHWLPVRQRVEFKVAILVHQAMDVYSDQALSGHAPSCLADDWCLIIDSRLRRLRSAETSIRFSSVRRGPTSETEPAVHLDIESGTIYWPTSDSWTCHTAVSDTCWRHFFCQLDQSAVWISL